MAVDGGLFRERYMYELKLTDLTGAVLQWDFVATRIDIAPQAFTHFHGESVLSVGTRVRVKPKKRSRRRDLPSPFGTVVEIVSQGYRVKHQVKAKKAPPTPRQRRGSRWKERQAADERVWRWDEVEALDDLEILGSALSY